MIDILDNSVESPLGVLGHCKQCRRTCKQHYLMLIKYSKLTILTYYSIRKKSLLIYSEVLIRFSRKSLLHVVYLYWYWTRYKHTVTQDFVHIAYSWWILMKPVQNINSFLSPSHAGQVRWGRSNNLFLYSCFRQKGCWDRLCVAEVLQSQRRYALKATHNLLTVFCHTLTKTLSILKVTREIALCPVCNY